MATTKCIKVYPSTHRRFQRAAKARRQTLAVVVDEASFSIEPARTNAEDLARSAGQPNKESASPTTDVPLPKAL